MKIKDYFDLKTKRICVAASVTVILTSIILTLLYMTGDFWIKIWSLVLAVIQPIIIGGIFCYLLAPLVERIESILIGSKKAERPNHLIRSISVLLSFLLVIVGILILLSLIIVTVTKSIESINIEALKNLVLSTQNDMNELASMAKEQLSKLGQSPENIGRTAILTVGAIKDFVTSLLFGAIFSIYFLLDGKRIKTYWTRAFQILAGKEASKKLDVFTSDANRVFSGYIRGQFLDVTIVGFLSSISMLVAGVPDAIIVGALAGLGNLIPYVGPVLGFLTLALVCIPVMAFDKFLIGAVILIVIMLVDSNLINPRLLSNNVEIHPLLVVAALLGGGALGGLVGMIAAVPVAALIKVQFDRYLDDREKRRQA